MTPIGLLGGTFDPIHHGHLRLAEEMVEALGLECVRFLPTGTPPHRAPPRAAASDRLAMVDLAIAGNPRFTLDRHEIYKTEPCYMVDTLSALRSELAANQAIVLFLGADAFAGLARWHRWRELFDLCHIAVAQRPGYDLEQAMPAELGGEFKARLTDKPGDLSDSPSGKVFRLAIAQLAISASHIRELVAAGRSPRYLLPDAVLDHIRNHHLYSQRNL